MAVTIVRFRAFDKTRKAMNKSMGEAARDLGLSLGKYMYLLFVQLPAVYAVRMVDKVFK